MQTGPAPLDAASLFARAACGLVRLRRDGTIVAANERFAAWVGHPVEGLVLRRRFQDLLTVGGKIFYQTHWTPLLQMQGSIAEVKLELVATSGARVPVLANAARHGGDEDAVVDVAVFVVRDRDAYERELVATHRRLEATLAEAAELHAQARTRATFAEQMIGIVSHDLRSPLLTIRMGASLLDEDATDDDRVTLQRIQRAVDRSSALIKDLLDFTQARIGGGIAVRLAPLALHRAIAETVDELRLAHPARELVHETRGTGECEADGARLAQVVGNLVSNACVYGRRDGAVRVTSETDAARWSVTVHNEGATIPADLQASLFEPLVRGESGRRGGNDGRSIGLGLFIVDQIARAHHGAAFVRSSDEGGTTFGVTIPAHP